MKNFNAFWICFCVIIICLILNFQSNRISAQDNVIIDLARRVSLIESNNVAIADSITTLSKDQMAFDDELIKKINEANKDLNNKIKENIDYNVSVVQQLRQISKVQGEIIKSFTSGFSTNAVDILR